MSFRTPRKKLPMNKVRRMDRRARSDKSAVVAQKQKFSDPSICDRGGVV